MATPSRNCAVRAPLISVAFLMALGWMQGSWPGTNCAPSALSAWANRIGAVSGSSLTRARASPSALSFSISAAGSARSTNSRSSPFTLSPTLAGSMKRVGRPVAGTMAKARATGVCLMSPPLILNSQAMESSKVRSTASACSSLSSACTSRILSWALRPAIFETMRHDRGRRRFRPVLPDNIDEIGVDGGELDARLGSASRSAARSL